MTAGLGTAALAVVGGHVAGQGTNAGTDAADWAEFQQRFVQPDGRVVDTGNRNISHSEGQSYGLLAALRANDRPAFQRILAWTWASLKRPQDNLFAWRWSPETTPNVTDNNNAADGCIGIAWALLEAAERWRVPDYRARALAVARDVQRQCFIELGGRWLLLPGAYGFRNANRVVVNLSYYMLPALQALGEALNDATWVRVEADGLALMRDARFGRWGLPPDWLELSMAGAAPAIARNWPPRYSFDAVRVPLFLAWGGSAMHPAVQACGEFYMHQNGRPVPAWADLSNDSLAPYAANAGITAVAALARAVRRLSGPALPRVAAGHDYYSAALTLLARAAWRDLRL